MSYSACDDYDFESIFSSQTIPATAQERWGHVQHCAESPVHPIGASTVGDPIQFSGGQFAGRTIRAALEELQKPVFGRKTVSIAREAKVDRRPLDPAPVASLSLFELFGSRTANLNERQIDYDSENVDLSGLMCSVDLFIVQPSPTPSPSASNGSISSTALSSTASPCKATSELVGTTVIQAVTIPWKGKTCVLFPFVDLSVKKEGHFVLQCVLLVYFIPRVIFFQIPLFLTSSPYQRARTILLFNQNAGVRLSVYTPPRKPRPLKNQLN
ncbi:Velvet domain-containing protein [Mycena sanguinolenta]|uniref:Velvet domain-containing protein n=1 Tax=Mycena sanguinolenta TaxID=230812 RepID=A0A8H6X6W5_9AGAR|nr:Velvet domain-containing protein [Mycena sanguinolenta]